MDTKELNLDLETVEQVADMLWLSSHIEKTKVEVQPNIPKPKEDVSEEEESPKKIKKSRKKPKEDLVKEEKKESSVYDNDACKTKTDIKADPIRMPKKLSLSHYRAWEKSFRSFYYKVDSTREFVLDEAKTVDLIAKTKLVQPIFKAKKVKYFHLVMVIEQSPSMDIWSELILEFQKTIQRFGVFESIAFYYLASDKKGVKLYTDRALKREVKYKKLNLSKQTLLTVVSDCVSSAWHSNHIFKMLEFWSKSVPVSITHMFPKRMWQGTSLYKGFQTSFTAHDFQPLNKHLKSDDGYYDEEDITFNIPIVNFEPQSVDAWASVIHGKRGKWIDGVILEDLEEKEFVEMTTNTNKISVEERVNRYLSQASPLAQELARYASVLPINFHVIRVLQELKLPKSNQIHLAEFFLGGLIKREVNEEKKVSFDFHDGVRDYFRGQLTATASYRIQELMSNFVSQNLNSSLDFQALIDNPNSTSGLFLSKDEVAFVKLRADTLRKMGGEYGRRGDALLEKLVLGGEETSTKEIKSEFLENFMPLSKLVGKDIEIYSRMFNYSFGLSARLSRSFSKKYSHEVLKEAMDKIVEVYEDVGWIKKLEKNRVLWVDDTPKNNKSTKDKFEKIGLKVDLALSTDEALEFISKNAYLVIISDIGIVEGKKEGYVFLDKLRTFDKNTPFIFFATNSDSPKNRKLTLERGGQGSTNDHIRLCRIVMNVVEDGRVEEEIVNPSIVLIESKNKENKSFGTGFSIYQDDGGSYIVTVNNILESIGVEELKIDDFKVSVYSQSEIDGINLAILYVKDLFLTPLELENNNLSTRGIYSIGHNLAKEEKIQSRVDGEILGAKISIVSSAKNKNYNLWKNITSLDKPLDSGYLGAPLISKGSGKVIGVLSDRTRSSGVFYAIVIEELKNVIAENSVLPFRNLSTFNLDINNSYFNKGNMHKSIVFISSKKNKSFGTGFVIHQDVGGSYIVTTNFVIESIVEPIINHRYSVEVIRLNEMFELAILYVKDFYEEPFTLQTEDFRSREISTIGYKAFKSHEYSKEIIEGNVKLNNLIIVNGKDNRYKGWEVIVNQNYQLTKGLAGAPLVSKETNKVIGVFTHSRSSGTEGYAVSIEHLKDIWNDK